MVANLLQASYQFADSLWIGNLLGAEALGAVAVSGVIAFTALSLVIGMNNAALTILSQQKGRNDHDGLRRYLNAFVVVLFVLAMVMGLAGYLLSGALLNLLGTPESIMSQAQDYLQITFLGIAFLYGYNFISMVMRALGDSRTPMRFVLLAVVLNIVLDPIFIHTFDLGVRGAAIATVLSQGVAFAYGLIYILRKRLAPFQVPTVPSGQEVRTILKLDFVLNGTVRASGAMYQVLALNIISFWVLRFPMTALFASVVDEAGVALGMGSSFVVSSMFAFGYYRFGKWRDTELFASGAET